MPVFFRLINTVNRIGCCLCFFLCSYVYAQDSLIYPLGTLPEQPVMRVLSAGRVSDVLLVSLAPEKLVGVTMALNGADKNMLPEQVRRLENIGRIAGRGSTAPLEKVVALKPDVIIDLGEVNDTFISSAQRVRDQTGIPYVLVKGRLGDSAQQIRQIGTLLGVKARSEKLADLAQRILDRTKNIARHSRTTLYFGRSADGLETGLAGSIHAEVGEWLGATNVADGIGQKNISRVSMEQLLQWQPEVIITQDANFYRKLQTDSLWQHLSAVKNQRFYLVPNEPFGWLDQPPGINRLLGCLWLAHKLEPTLFPQEEYIALLTEYFQTFYGYSLNAQELSKFIGHP
ncbi:iron ABC transporter substrate-binding protein [Necropsobacter massiliensis]|uniref:iron ABC transporter substrate-binding protein n=1 Tax=Necropsobacter massiliensis TaxID=1400001 RepID=UPI0006934468|nr:iron ABC transporter substrate-binding protein [Necropsobacter massiliensis]